MANIKSQIKRNKQAEKANLRNSSAKSAVRTAMKKVREAVKLGDKDKATALMADAFKLIDKTVSDGIQHENTAARQKGELSRLVNSLSK